VNLPDGVTEVQFLASVEKQVNILAPQFKIGSFDLDDLKQEGRLEAWRKLDKYDVSRPLDNFLYTVIKNRYTNLYRDLVRRSDPPCSGCHKGNPPHAGGEVCKPYADWKARNNSKASLNQLMGLDNVPDEKLGASADISEAAQVDEAVRLLNEQLPVDLRSDYLRMRAGETVPKARRRKVENAVREILACLTSNADD
jgi:RNA polymerase sigma factor (sigma-70 family)